MNQLPFKAYDVFAYLASGSVVAAGADYIYGSQWLLQEKRRLPTLSSGLD